MTTLKLVRFCRVQAMFLSKSSVVILGRERERERERGGKSLVAAAAQMENNYLTEEEEKVLRILSLASSSFSLTTAVSF